MSEFWINNPSILFNNIKLQSLWPTNTMSFNEKLNSISKLVIILTIAGVLLTQSNNILLVGIITLGVIIFLYYNKKDNKENFQNSNSLMNIPKNIYYNSNWKNPFSNVLLPEINNNANRKSAPPAFNNKINKTITDTTKEMIQQLNPDQPNIDKKLFRDLGDNFNLRNSLITFNSNPNTQIPNDQDGFAQFCYGNMPSCKEGNNPANCVNNPPRIGAVYN